MKLLMHVLKRNKSLGIDNENIKFNDIKLKLIEEHTELINALDNYMSNATFLNLKEVIRETFDVIQVCILILWKSKRKADDLDCSCLIEEINIEHKDKLVSRGWKIKTGISIDVKE